VRLLYFGEVGAVDGGNGILRRTCERARKFCALRRALLVLPAALGILSELGCLGLGLPKMSEYNWRECDGHQSDEASFSSLDPLLGRFRRTQGAQVGGLTREEIKECGRQPLTLACVEHYAQRNQENVAKVLGDITSGRLPALPPPALPGLESLPTIDLGELTPKK